MISMNAISSAGGAAKYYTDQARIEYYSDESVPSSWGGQGSKAMGLSGEVVGEDLTSVLNGKVLEVDSEGNAREVQLGRTTIDKDSGDRKIEHRAGWDLTFAPPKSVSIESEVFGKSEVREAHERAVKTAMAYMENNAAQTRVNGKMVQTGNLTYASFGHATSRAGDPQTHTHVLVANVTYLDGRAYSLSNEKILQHRSTIDAVYKNELASILQENGYKLEYDGRGNFEISGYRKSDLSEFSKRSEQISDALNARGADRESASHESRQIAALATRNDKSADHSESASAHRDRWLAEASDAGIKPAQVFNYDTGAIRPPAEDVVRSAIKSLAEREQEFSHKDLVKEAMLQSSGRATSSDLLKEIDLEIKSGYLVDRGQDKSGPRFTTQTAIAGELWADKQISAGREGHTQILSEREFNEALSVFELRKSVEAGQRFELNAEQRQAAYSVLTGSDQFSGVQGSAGTGKTTMLEFVREASESKGWTVYGMSNGASQAAKLEADSGIKSTTTSAFLASQKDVAEVGQSRILYVNDEASMSGQKEFNGVIQATLNSGAKTVFVGDKAQHQSVSAGGAFERAQDQMHVSKLVEINRQKTEEAKAPVRSVIAGDHAAAIKQTAVEFSTHRQAVLTEWGAIESKQNGVLTKDQTLAKREALKEASQDDNRAAINGLARDYANQSVADREKTAIVTATNADREAINMAVRSELQTKGELGSGHNVETLKAKDFTEAQAKQAASYQQGDLLKQSSKNGDVKYLRVQSVDAFKNNLTLVGDDGASTVINAKSASKMRAYTATEKEFATGDKVAFFENDKRSGVRNGDVGYIIKMSGQRMTVDINGKTKDIDMRSYKQIDHGYVMTSFKAQGQTVHHAMVHHNTDGGMHGQRETYVNVTRARFKTTTYTQHRDKASLQAAKEVNKSVAVRRRSSVRQSAQDRVQSRNDNASHVSQNEKSFDLSFVAPSYENAKGGKGTSHESHKGMEGKRSQEMSLD